MPSELNDMVLHRAILGFEGDDGFGADILQSAELSKVGSREVRLDEASVFGTHVGFNDGYLHCQLIGAGSTAGNEV